jgi:hypothetical protein
LLVDAGFVTGRVNSEESLGRYDVVGRRIRTSPPTIEAELQAARIRA